jgi:hypothetical protein
MSPKIIDNNFLSKNEIEDIKTKVFLLKENWVALGAKEEKTFSSIITRMMPAGMYASQFDANNVLENNKLMYENFSVYYNKIKEKLSAYYNMPVDYSNNFQLPGFHIFVTNNVKNISYTNLNFHRDGFKHFTSSKIDSIVIPISLPNIGGSLLFNDPPEIFLYKEGMMGIWPGNIIHSIEPFTFSNSSECRITMQMHVTMLPNKKRMIFW